MNFFFDMNISYRISNMLAALYDDTHNIVHITQDSRFVQNNRLRGNTTSDIDYLALLGADDKPWNVISGDCDIVDTAHERAALIKSGVTFFAFDKHWPKSGAADQPWKIAKIWSEIVRHANQPGPGLYVVHMGKKLYVETINTGMRARGGKFRA
jgi:hypothetical protein